VLRGNAAGSLETPAILVDVVVGILLSQNILERLAFQLGEKESESDQISTQSLIKDDKQLDELIDL
jgi:hypothetical protein